MDMHAGDLVTIPGGSIGGVNIADDVIVTVTTAEVAWVATGLQGKSNSLSLHILQQLLQ